ncbi:MAG TPA: YCF48-related protein [Kofleriaceae bacterium]|nr:YCF48-related protein [Kofleriaceae bacterium]
MKIQFATSLIAASAAALLIGAGGAGCKKKGDGGGPGPGGWLVGSDGLMASVDTEGALGPGYDLDSDHDLLGIACRGLDTAFVVGELGTFLRTFDGGESWDVIDLDTTRTLRSVAAADDVVYTGGDGLLLRSPDRGTTWAPLPVDPSASWNAVTTGHGGAALALSASGAVWRHDSATDSFTSVATLAGARVVSMSHDGLHAVVAGAGRSILRSDDGGLTWRSIELGASFDLHDAWVTGAGETIAVGADGMMVRVARTDAVTSAQIAPGTLRTIHINARGVGLAAGDDGVVVSTEDGGSSWVQLPLGLTRDVFAVDEVAGDGHL